MNLSMENICKSFGANPVLIDVNFSLSCVDEGEICALIGENGAGKSTLMNILGGVISKDKGEIVIDGNAVHFDTPADSLNAGIAFIHQELNLINDLMVYENMFLGHELKKPNGMLDAPLMIDKAKDIFNSMNIAIDPTQMVGSMDASYKQIVEIARALLMNASVLIMDEPTTSLTETEIGRVFLMMRQLKKNGVCIVFISHKLKEVLQICDRYVVLRDGRMVASGGISGVTVSDLSALIVGRQVNIGAPSCSSFGKEEVLRLESLSDKNGRRFRNISLSLHKGEILGVTGLLGDGRSELFRAVFGEGVEYSGSIYLNGHAVKPKSASHSIDMGIAYLPPNRKENGILKDMSIIENATITTWRGLSRLGFLKNKSIENEFMMQKERLNIKLSEKTDLITSLSGGNQQKVMLAKWLSTKPSVLILDNPTQGVDVGAKEEIYEIISNLANQGVAIILLSGEVQEIMRMCRRAIVMFHGAIQGQLVGAQVTEQEMMLLATGGCAGSNRGA